MVLNTKNKTILNRYSVKSQQQFICGLFCNDATAIHYMHQQYYNIIHYIILELYGTALLKYHVLFNGLVWAGSDELHTLTLWDVSSPRPVALTCYHGRAGQLVTMETAVADT